MSATDCTTRGKGLINPWGEVGEYNPDLDEINVSVSEDSAKFYLRTIRPWKKNSTPWVSVEFSMLVDNEGYVMSGHYGGVMCRCHGSFGTVDSDLNQGIRWEMARAFVKELVRTALVRSYERSFEEILDESEVQKKVE